MLVVGIKIALKEFLLDSGGLWLRVIYQSIFSKLSTIAAHFEPSHWNLNSNQQSIVN
jgi:hypothetical protein